MGTIYFQSSPEKKEDARVGKNFFGKVTVLLLGEGTEHIAVKSVF